MIDRLYIAVKEFCDVFLKDISIAYMNTAEYQVNDGRRNERLGPFRVILNKFEPDADVFQMRPVALYLPLVGDALLYQDTESRVR